MPAKEAILIATGNDRPGVLDDISMYLHEKQADILESRVSLLRGQFGLLLLIRAEDESMDQIEAGLSVIARSAGITAELRPATETTRDDTPLRLTASGKDPANAVHRISHLMRVLNVNIQNIETHADGKTPGSAGEFSLTMELCVPRSTPLMMLKQYVQSLTDEFGINCDVQAL